MLKTDMEVSSDSGGLCGDQARNGGAHHAQKESSLSIPEGNGTGFDVLRERQDSSHNEQSRN